MTTFTARKGAPQAPSGASIQSPPFAIGQRLQHRSGSVSGVVEKVEYLAGWDHFEVTLRLNNGATFTCGHIWLEEVV